MSKTEDASAYDMAEGLEKNENVSNNGDEDNEENSVIENPYYIGDDGISSTGSAINVIDNPYYGGPENDGDEARIKVLDNPYYEGIDNEGKSDKE